MPYNRRIYATTSLFVGPSGFNATGRHLSSGNSGANLLMQISRVQSINDGFELPRQNVPQYGQLAPISREITDSPNVSLSFSYYPTDGLDEKKLGFFTAGSGSSGALTNILLDIADERNYFIPTVAEGNDAVGSTSAEVVDVRAIGNAFISSYSVEASVGGFLSSNMSVEAINAKYDIGGSGNGIPAINPQNGALITGLNYIIPAITSGNAAQPIVIKQGDISIDLSAVDAVGARLTGVGGAHIQSFNLNIPIAREVLNRLGNRFAYAREITFPVDVTLGFNALLNDLNSGSVSSLFCSDRRYDINISCRTQTCDGSTGSNLLVYTLRGAQLDSMNFGGSIGPAQTVDVNFTSSIGGPNDTSRNFYISGSRQG